VHQQIKGGHKTDTLDDTNQINISVIGQEQCKSHARLRQTYILESGLTASVDSGVGGLGTKPSRRRALRERIVTDNDGMLSRPTAGQGLVRFVHRLLITLAL
jgi:hypothetical protein